MSISSDGPLLAPTWTQRDYFCGRRPTSPTGSSSHVSHAARLEIRLRAFPLGLRNAYCAAVWNKKDICFCRNVLKLKRERGEEQVLPDGNEFLRRKSGCGVELIEIRGRTVCSHVREVTAHVCFTVMLTNVENLGRS